MIILSSKKTKVVFAAGKNIIEYNNDFYLDADTNTIYNKSSVNLNTIDDKCNGEVLFNPTKFLFEDNQLIENPYFKEQYTFSETMYNDMQSNIDYLMLLNDPDSTSETVTE